MSPRLTCAAWLGLALAGRAADAPGLGYRGVLQPADMESKGARTGSDIWRISAAQGLPPAEKSAATTVGYGWLTEGAEPWNMVNTFTTVEPPPPRHAPRFERPGDFYYVFPIFDRTTAVTQPPRLPEPPPLASTDPYRAPRPGNAVVVTPNPSLPVEEKVFVRYTLDNWTRTLTPPEPAPPAKP